MSAMKTVFMTGGSGFVGWHLAKRLRSLGLNVRCLLRKNSDRSRLEPLGVEPVEGDLADLEALRRGVRGADTVFHLAGATRALVRNDFFAANQFGCRNIAQAICEAAPLSSPPTLISVSSLAAVGAAFKRSKEERRLDGRKFAPVIETSLPVPVSAYGKSKSAGERELLAYADQIPISVVRPAIVFGEGDRLMLPLFKMVKRMPFYLVPGFWNYPFSFVYAEDLIDLLLQVAERGERVQSDSLAPLCEAAVNCSGRGFYMAAHPESPPMSEFGRMLGRACGRSRLWTPRIPPRAVLVGGLAQEVYKKLSHKNVPFDWDKAREAIGGPWICSSEKAWREFGWRPTAALADEVRQTADWYRENRWL